MTFASIEQRDMDIALDGSFVLTLDSNPANGRRNHLQIAPGARHINVRDTMSDWRQGPDALRIRRLNPPTRARLTEDELTARAVQEIRSNVYFMYYALRFYFNGPPRTMSNPKPITSTSALPTQTSSSGYLRLAPDEAAILTATAPDALYRSIVLHDLWNRSLEYRITRAISTNRRWPWTRMAISPS